MTILTCVSGYWNVTNKHGNKFNNWFNDTLKINNPYVFFCENKDRDYISKYRTNLSTNLSTYFIDYNLSDFYTNKFNFDASFTHLVHCPSIELGKIWLEKINLMFIASKQNPFNSKWFMWVDAGVCVLRDKQLDNCFNFKNLDSLECLDKNKLYYTSTNDPHFNYLTINYLLYTHEIAGTAFLIHRDKIEFFKNLFYKYVELLLKNINLVKSKFFILSDQCIWSLILSKHPELFYKLGNGYGELINLL
jgi:hypothetical protein